jgi:hypothetical protein
MTVGSAKPRAWTGRIAAGAALLLAAAAPAAAEQSRATLSVTAVVAPACRVEAGQGPDRSVACSPGTSFSAATVTRRDERPIDAAAAILGAPARGARGIMFAGPVQAPAAASEAASPGGTRYLTLTY